jgi:hypothetical protein
MLLVEAGLPMGRILIGMLGLLIGLPGLLTGWAFAKYAGLSCIGCFPIQVGPLEVLSDEASVRLLLAKYSNTCTVQLFSKNMTIWQIRIEIYPYRPYEFFPAVTEPFQLSGV